MHCASIALKHTQLTASSITMASTEADIEQGYVEETRQPRHIEVLDAERDDMTYKTSEGVETMLYDEAPPTCWSRFKGEWKLKFFELSETDEAMVNVQKSFAPPPVLRTFILKAALTGWSISILVTDLLSGSWNPISYYMIYLSNWALAITILYFLVSLTNTVIGTGEQRPYEDIPGFMVRFAWGLYPTAAVVQMAATILFWVLQYDKSDPVTYKMVMKHGGFMALVILEGRFINRIPVRQKHLLFPITFMTLYVIWTVVHNVFNLGNPYVADSDAIYESLDWQNNLTASAVTSVVLILGITPLMFLNTWLLSIWSFPFHFDGLNRAHYYLEETKKDGTWWDNVAEWWQSKTKKPKEDSRGEEENSTSS
jgi:hypothetical protein